MTTLYEWTSPRLGRIRISEMLDREGRPVLVVEQSRAYPGGWVVIPWSTRGLAEELAEHLVEAVAVTLRAAVVFDDPEWSKGRRQPDDKEPT